MTVQCAKCGEELMGSVNRCWRCGQEFVARAGDAGLPPIRRGPVVIATANASLDERSEAIPTTVNVPLVANHDGSDQTHKDQTHKVVRWGSPFANRGTATMVSIDPESVRRTHDESLDREANYRKNGGAAAGAALTIPLGLISLVAAFVFPLAGFPLALLGLGFGIWGFRSRRQRLAFAGLLLCCISLAIASFYGSIEVYTNIYGITPWEDGISLP